MGLNRNVSLKEAVFYGVGTIVGAGIYALVGIGAGIAGNALWISFLLGAAIAALTAFCYAELSSFFPKEAAEYVYITKSFGSRRFAFIISWLVILSALFAIATVSVAFGNYLSPLIGVPPLYISIFLIIFVTIINAIGIKQSLGINMLLTISAIIGLLLIVFFGAGSIGSVDYFVFEIPPLFYAASIMFFAFIGFEEVANIAEEIKEPRKNVPKAILYSVLISSIIYILISIVAVSVIPAETLAQSKVPLADVAHVLMGPNAFLLLSLIALAATGNTVLNTSIATSRQFYGLGMNKVLPSIFSKVSTKTQTPVFSIFIAGAFSLILLFSGNIEFLAEMTTAGVFIVFIATNLSYIKTKYDFPMRKIFNLPSIKGISILGILAIIANLILFFSLPLTTIFYISILTLIGFPLYYISDHLSKKYPHSLF